MDKHPDITNFAVSLIIKAVIIAARFSGVVRKRSLRRLAAMDADAKDKENGPIFRRRRLQPKYNYTTPYLPISQRFPSYKPWTISDL